MTEKTEALRDITLSIEKVTGCTEYLLLREVFVLCQRNDYYPPWFANWCSEFGQAIRAFENEDTYMKEGYVVYAEGIKHCTEEYMKSYLESLQMDMTKI